MRVYGSSPLYNYVELMFRSKRLFIASILVATLVTVGMAARRAGTYTAEARIMLTGENALGVATDASTGAIGTVKFKLNFLNLSSQNPQFWKDAMARAGFDRGKSAVEFDKFCKEVRGAISYAAGDNVLVIYCRWPTPEADDLINAFYSLYADQVVEAEVANSATQTKMVREMLADYTNKEKKLDRLVQKYREDHGGMSVPDPMGAFNTARAQKNYVRGLENMLSAANRELTATTNALKTTPVMIKSWVDSKADTGTYDFQLQQAQNALKAAQEVLTGLEARYTERDPRVRAAAAQRDTAREALDKLQKNAPTGDGPQVTSGVRMTRNPQYAQLEKHRTDVSIAIEKISDQLGKERQTLVTLEREARDSPKALTDYKWMTSKYGMYASIRAGLMETVEKSAMDEARTRALRLSEIKMMVEPKAELETVGAKSMLMYAAGPILGLIIAFAFSLFSETMDHSLRTPIEVEKYLGKPVLAVLPNLDARGRKGDARRIGGGGGDARQSLTS